MWLETYQEYVGDSEIPPLYDVWSAISLIAAAMEDRVWFEKFPGKKLYPNLYTILLGPSGIGKDVAIDRAIDLLTATFKDGSPRFPALHSSLFYGKATIQYLMDWLAERGQAEGAHGARLYLVTPELTSSISAGSQAADFLRVITDLYIPKGRTWQEGTRTRGGIQIQSPLCNWIAGTTLQWLVSNIPYDALEGGFLGRVAIASATYDFDKRVYAPRQPANALELREALLKHLGRLTRVDGALVLSEEARAIDEAWYMERMAPVDESMAAAWRRQHDLVLKVGMALSLMGELDGVVGRAHIVRAQQLVEASFAAIPRVNSMAGSSKIDRGIVLAETRIRSAGKQGITRSSLVKYLSHHKINAWQLDREVLSTLKEKGRVIEVRGAKGAKVYVWKPPILHASPNNDLPEPPTTPLR